jgi:glycosyltransferase involved in cell wall biosynthesis
VRHPDELTIYLPDGRLAPPQDAYGRLVANAGVYRALARHGGYRRLHFQCRKPPAAAQLRDELLLAATGTPGPAGRGGAGGTEVSSGSPVSTASPVRSGMLLSGQPYLSAPAWVRRHAGLDAAYSIAGTVFAFSSPQHRELMLHSLLAPLFDWDALVCSSPTLRRTVDRTVDTWEDYLRETLGAGAPGVAAVRLPRPQLPVIPFGVDDAALAGQAADGAARKAVREAHGVADSDAVVFSLGRLSFYDKAFPQAMFRIVEAAQERTGVRTHFLMAGWFPSGERDRMRYETAARRHAPNVHVEFLDGNDRAVVAGCWAAADVFLLLSDTIIETFGQALTEAMAAGLPVVASDWDGYRSIVRDGVDGFLAPTLGAPPGPLGESLALLEAAGVADYPRWAGSTAQHTAVHVGRAATALTELIASPDLRARMGRAGRARVRQLFSWPVVVGRYQELFAELEDRRTCAAGTPPSGRDEPLEGAPARSHRMPPLRNDPFADFRDLPGAVLDDDLVLRLAPGGSPPDPEVELDDMFSALRGTPEEATRVLAALCEAGALTVAELVATAPPERRPFVRMTLCWLAKAGVLDWLPSGEDA